MIQRVPPQATFKLQGIVGKIWDTPHDRYVGKVVVVELHVQPLVQVQVSKSSLLDSWYVLFEDPSKIQGIKTGIRVEITGSLERSRRAAPTGVELQQIHLQPMSHFFWGKQWQEIHS